MKTNYSTIVLRYVHDVVTGEFVNIGVVLYAPEAAFLKARFCGSCERLEAMFLKIDRPHLTALIGFLANRFEEIGAKLHNDRISRSFGSVAGIVNQVLPPDDSSLQWSKEVAGFTDNPEKVLNEMYIRWVERYRRPEFKAAKLILSESSHDDE